MFKGDLEKEHGEPVSGVRIRFEVEIDADLGNVGAVYEKLMALDDHVWVRIVDVGVIPGETEGHE